MTKGKDDKSHAQARQPADPREARLAQALRANLRRRKGAASIPPPLGEEDRPKGGGGG